MDIGVSDNQLEDVIGGRKRLLVRQVKEWGEILIGVETRNRYEILDDRGEVLAYAAEDGRGAGGVIGRQLLGARRAATVRIFDLTGRPMAIVEKPFRFFFHRMELYENGVTIGAIRRRWSWFHRLFTVEDNNGNDVLSIRSPWLRFWTFKLLVDDQEVGRVKKRWGGALKELLSDADSFGVEFHHERLPMQSKKLLLAASFLIDFTCFESGVGGWLNVIDSG